MRITVGDLRATIEGLNDNIPIYLWSDTIDDANLIANKVKRGNVLDIGDTDEETYSGEAVFIYIDELELLDIKSIKRG